MAYDTDEFDVTRDYGWSAGLRRCDVIHAEFMRRKEQGLAWPTLAETDALFGRNAPAQTGKEDDATQERLQTGDR